MGKNDLLLTIFIFFNMLTSFSSSEILKKYNYYSNNISYKCPANISVVGLILARQGSKGILHKNLALINGSSLLARTIKAMKEFNKFSSIWVSTDGEKIAAEAVKFGNVNIHWRSHKTATDTATSLFAIQEFLKHHKGVEAIALVQCTSPFLNKKYLEEAYELIQQGFDTVFSVTKEYKLRWKRNFDGEIIPLNFNPAKRPRRQDWDGELVENGMFYFTHRKFIEEGLLQAGRISVVEIPKYFALEIDTPEDLKLAQILTRG